MEERKEQQPQAQLVEQVVKEIPEAPEVTGEIAKLAKPTPTQFTAKITDPKTGKPLVTSPATQSVTISIPASSTQLLNWAKGSPKESLTWFANFWLRLIKKALHFGWRVVMGGGQKK